MPVQFSGYSPNTTPSPAMRRSPVPDKPLFSSEKPDRLEISGIQTAKTLQDAKAAKEFSDKVFGDNLTRKIDTIAELDGLSPDFVRQQVDQSRQDFFDGLINVPRRALLLAQKRGEVGGGKIAGGEIKGIIALKQFQYGSPAVDPKTKQGWLIELATLPKNPALEARLAKKGIEEARKAGYTSLHTSATPQEIPLFEKLGFRPWGPAEREEHPHAVQQWQQAGSQDTLMVKDL